MDRKLDMKGLVAHLTGTDPSTWEPFMGRKQAVGDEQAFTETGRFGPYDEDVADMVRDGYTSGDGWSLETNVDLSEDEDAAYEIARLISGGCTSGYGPVWSVSMEKRVPGEAYVQIVDEDVTVTMEATADHDAISFSTTIEELASDPETASLVADTVPAMRM